MKKSNTRNGVRTHACICTLVLETNAITTRPPWLDCFTFNKEGTKDPSVVHVSLVSTEIRSALALN